MEKVCINDFSPSELKAWMKEFYPNGLNRVDLEKASNTANIRYHLRKRYLLENLDIHLLSSQEKSRLNEEKKELGVIASQFEEAESDFIIARNWYKKSVKDNKVIDNQLFKELKSINFDFDFLNPN